MSRLTFIFTRYPLISNFNSVSSYPITLLLELFLTEQKKKVFENFFFRSVCRSTTVAKKNPWPPPPLVFLLWKI